MRILQVAVVTATLAQPGWAHLSSSEPPAVAANEIMVQRLGAGYAGESLIQVCVGINPPVAQLPNYQIDGVGCDVFPLGRDGSGNFTAAHLVAKVPNPGGLAGIPGIDPALPQLTMGGSGASPAQIQRVGNFKHLTLSVSPSGLGSDMICRPFDRNFAGRLQGHVRLNGEFVRQRVSVSQFVQPGASEPFSNADTALVVVAVLTERADLPGATLDLMVANGAYDLDSPALGQNAGSDGPFFFREMSLDPGIAGAEATLFEERPGSFELDTNGHVLLVAQPTEGFVNTGDQVNNLMPGSYFARRMLIWDRAGFASAGIGVPIRQDIIAQEIVDRRDFGWCTGDLGYISGGYGAAQMSLLDMGSQSFNGAGFQYQGHSGWRASHERGLRYEQDAAGELHSPNLLLDPANEIPGSPAAAYAGWFKGFGGTVSDPTGEDDIAFAGYTWPSNGEMKGRLIRGDGYMERDHRALFDVDSGDLVTDTDYANQGGGVIPTGFSGVARPEYFLVPQHYAPRFEGSIQGPASGASWASTASSATLNLPWNEPASTEVCPYMFLNDWNHRSTFRPLNYTHAHRPLSQWRASAFGMNDALSWLAIEMQAHHFSFAASRFDVDDSGSNRFRAGRDETNLFSFATRVVQSGLLQSTVGERKGVWPAPGTIVAGGAPDLIEFNTPRSLIVPWDALAMHWTGANDSERQRWRAGLSGAGQDPSHDVVRLLGLFYAKVPTEDGMLCSTGRDQGQPRAMSDYMTADLAALTGSIPAPPGTPGLTVNYTVPINYSGNDVPHWTYNSIYQQAYAACGLRGLQQSVLGGSVYAGQLDRVAGFADVWAEAGKTVAGAQTEVPFPAIYPASVGVLGLGNPYPSEAQSRAGQTFWWLTTQTLSTERKELHYAFLSSWTFDVQGAWNETLGGLRRNFGIVSTTLPELELNRLLADDLWSQFNSFSSSATQADTEPNFLIPLMGLLNQQGF